jgi:serine/threonine protein kinase
MARFTREAQMLASMNHPNIDAIYGVEELAFIMALMETETLHSLLLVETALNYARQILEQLEYACERGIIHRDLKLANIKVTPEGRVKVLDFGTGESHVPRAGGEQSRILAHLDYACDDGRRDHEAPRLRWRRSSPNYLNEIVLCFLLLKSISRRASQRWKTARKAG